ncbi:DNA-binding response regulator, partial [Salmonella enterica subsp. enterica serovar Newport]|nr:DNA-binding response regulator [Salmonella enterica subsp. enterica serovar Newport]
LVVEDNQALADGLVAVLRAGGYAVDHMSDGASAIDVLSAEQVDLVVLDLNLPGMDGLDVLRAIRRMKESPVVLILSARGAYDERVRGLDLGADDYLTKPFDVGELEARVRMLLRRRSGQRAPGVEFGRLKFDRNSRNFFIDDALLDLPAREVGLLETLILRAGKVVTKQSIIESLSSLDEELSPNAIEQYVSRIRRRLAPAGLTIRTARGIGYYLEASRE